jgi:DNA-binding MarR family transcriptional regulator
VTPLAPAANPPADAPADPPAGRFVNHYLGYLLGQANHAVFKDLEPDVRAAGLSSIEWRVLATLHDSPPLAVSPLAREVLSQQPTVTKLVQRMAAQGWVSLSPCPSDQRRTLVAITSTGSTLVQPLLAQARAREAQALAPWSSADVAALKRLLGALSGSSPPIAPASGDETV